MRVDAAEDSGRSQRRAAMSAAQPMPRIVSLESAFSPTQDVISSYMNEADKSGGWTASGRAPGPRAAGADPELSARVAQMRGLRNRYSTSSDAISKWLLSRAQWQGHTDAGTQGWNALALHLPAPHDLNSETLSPITTTTEVDSLGLSTPTLISNRGTESMASPMAPGMLSVMERTASSLSSGIYTERRMAPPPVSFEAAQDETASRVAKDLFADEDAPPPTQSTYERRMAALKEEIRAYEQENVQDKDWTLMGEANVAERPADSLLEEDLEFERTAKLAPAVTQEETEEIEAMVKRRILEKQFDDVIRQREIDPLPFVPSHLLELSDAKSSKSLAELYEDEYQSAREAAEGGMPRAESDVKLEREHSVIAADIEALFGKLDALSNAHYTPKAPKAAIETLSNTAAIEMENSLPTTMSTGTMLAPEEVYTASTHGAAMTGAKSEMTPQEKRRLHNQLRQSKRKRNDRIKRSRDAFDLSRGAPRRENTHEEKDKALKSLVGNKGVSVVGKDSKRQSVKEAVSGKKQKTQATQSPAGSQWKL